MQTFTQSHKAIIQGGGSVSKHLQQHFAPEATVLYVPTGVLASTPIHVEAMLQEYSRQAHTIQSEEVLSSTYTESTIVEESIMTLNHSDQITWLLPSVRATNKEIKVVLITIFTLNADSKVTSKRVYWDQASVLRQIGVLPRSLYCKANSSEVTLPILGAEIASKVASVTELIDLGSLTIGELNDEVKPVENKQFNPRRNEGTNTIFTAEAPILRASSRATSIAGSKTSDIFGLLPPNSPVYHNKAHVRLHPHSSDIFGLTTNPTPNNNHKTHLAAPGGSPLNLFDASSKIEPPTKADVTRRDPNWSSSTTEVPEHRTRPSSAFSSANQSSFSFNEQDEPKVQYHSARRMLAQSNQTSFIFGDHASDKITGVKRRDPNARSEEKAFRSSSRVLNVPGGKSTFTFA